LKQKLKQAILRAPAKRWTCTLIALAVSMLVGWYAGVDLLQRGPAQAFVLIESILVTALVWMCPIWPKREHHTSNTTSNQEAQ
jgi:hypothetical protein